MEYSMQEMLETSVRLARQSGEMLRSEFHRRGGFRIGPAGPLIDIEIECLLREELTSRFPKCGFRAEENPELNRGPEEGCHHTWLVDPHDGTTAATRGQRGATISLGLINEQGEPVLGVVYAYTYPDDGGDLLSWAEGCGGLHRNGLLYHGETAQTDLVLVSRTANSKSLAYSQTLQELRYHPLPGIAYRLALAAAGEADAAISLQAPRDFDCAGGHALLRGAGYDLWDERGRPIRYSHTTPTQFGFCFGGKKESCLKLLAIDWQPVLRASASKFETRFDWSEARQDTLEPDPEILNRAQGAFMGQLIGDALGSQVEFKTPEQIRQLWPQSVNELKNGGVFSTLAGQPTDDSELALMLARSLLEHGDYAADHVATSYRYWFDSQPFDSGDTIKQSLQEVTESAPAQSARLAASVVSQANGALMRVSPIALAGVHRSEEWTLRTAAEDARLTHPHEVCIGANQVYAVSLREAIKSKLAPLDVWEYALETCRAIAAPRAIENALLAARNDGPPKDYMKHMGWVLLALQGAFAQLFQDGTAAQRLSNTVSFGGDTDTNGCITGALLGSVYGRRQWPSAWVRTVITCRACASLENVSNPRPADLWPIDALVLSEHLVASGGIQ